MVLSEQGLVAALRADLASAEPPVPVDGDEAQAMSLAARGLAYARRLRAPDPSSGDRTFPEPGVATPWPDADPGPGRYRSHYIKK